MRPLNNQATAHVALVTWQILRLNSKRKRSISAGFLCKYNNYGACTEMSYGSRQYKSFCN